MQAGGQRFESVILHRFGASRRRAIFDILGKRNVRSVERAVRLHAGMPLFGVCGNVVRTYKSVRKYITTIKKKVGKGIWRMPRLLQAMKDVISCEKPGRGANDL